MKTLKFNFISPTNTLQIFFIYIFSHLKPLLYTLKIRKDVNKKKLVFKKMNTYNKKLKYF